MNTSSLAQMSIDIDNRARQKKDPTNWPYAYLLSVPRFLWWERSVVSFWYLYSSSLELDAVIMEINNSFDEKRNVFFQVQRCSTSTSSEEIVQKDAQYIDRDQNVLSLSSLPGATIYKGTWEKKIFASPFEKVEGSISNRFMDPLQPIPRDQKISLINTTSIGVSGEPKMITRISCQEPPMDPRQADPFQLAKLLLFWTIPITLTTPRIIFQALRIHYILRLMKMMNKSEIQRGSIPRHATTIERYLVIGFHCSCLLFLQRNINTR